MTCNGSNCSCNGNCKNNETKEYHSEQTGKITMPLNDRYFFDGNGYIIGSSGISYKYSEDCILEDLKNYIDKTYNEHYMTEEQSIDCFDAWIALGDSTPTFRNTALKYLWRYGKKNGNNKQDLMKALHYIFMCLYVDHYRKDEK